MLIMFFCFVRCVVKRGEKEGDLAVTPDIVCENFMEAQTPAQRAEYFSNS